MSNNQDGVEGRSSSVTSKNTWPQIIPLVSYLAVWMASLIAFWLLSSGSDALGYSILFLWGLLPAATLASSFFIGKHDDWGRGRWLFSLFFGIMYLLAEYTTFGAANMIAFGKLNQPEWLMLPVGVVISLAGIGAGSGISRRCGKK